MHKFPVATQLIFTSAMRVRPVACPLSPTPLKRTRGIERRYLGIYRTERSRDRAISVDSEQVRSRIARSLLAARSLQPAAPCRSAAPAYLGCMQNISRDGTRATVGKESLGQVCSPTPLIDRQRVRAVQLDGGALLSSAKKLLSIYTRAQRARTSCDLGGSRRSREKKSTRNARIKPKPSWPAKHPSIGPTATPRAESHGSPPKPI